MSNERNQMLEWRTEIVALAEMPGWSNRRIGELLGVSAQRVDQIRNINTHRDYDRNRFTPAPRRRYVCSVCGEAGHSKNRHEAKLSL